MEIKDWKEYSRDLCLIPFSPFRAWEIIFNQIWFPRDRFQIPWGENHCKILNCSNFSPDDLEWNCYWFMVLFEEIQNTVNWEERVPQKEENNLIANLNLNGKEKRKRKAGKKKRDNKAKGIIFPLSRASKVGRWCGNRILTLPWTSKNSTQTLELNISLCVLVLSLQNEPPCDILHQTGQFAEATNPDNQF